MCGGCFYCYNIVGDEIVEVVLLEEEFVVYVGVKYCLVVVLGGYLMIIVFWVCSVGQGDVVLINVFIFVFVLGVIVVVGVCLIYVEVIEDLVIDFDDLVVKIDQVLVLFLFYMCGYICDMDVLMVLCDVYGVIVIEDCVYMMGVMWNGF